MEVNERERLILLGGGLSGSLLSLMLANQGYAVQVAEARPDMRIQEVDGGRSINLALSARGLNALDRVGLKEKALSLSIPMKGRMIHPIEGDLQFQPYGQHEEEVINSISRAELNKLLMTAAEETGHVEFFFNTRCMGMELDDRLIYLRNEITQQTWSVQVHRVIACDGIGSPIRITLLKRPQYKYDPKFLDHGYKELTIPPAPDGSHQLDKNALHIWPRGDFMLIALPNLDGSFTCTLFLKYESEDENEPSFKKIGEDEMEMRAFFKEYFPDVPPLMPDLEDEYFENPVAALGSIQFSPWYYEDAVVLVGDAAHAIVPFFGQGMNCAFEDCAVFEECLEKYEGDWKRIFKTFDRKRKVNTDAIAEMSMKNFLEMRDWVGDPKFLLRKQLELELEKRNPGVFIPQYSMVSFHLIPYAEVLKRGKIQDEILDQLLADADSLDAIDFEQADQRIQEALAPLEAPSV